MVKILVNSLPEKPNDCPFAITSKSDWCLSNCSLKCNRYANGEGYIHFTNSTNRITCSLHENKECPYLQLA